MEKQFMPTFTDRELLIAQIIGGATIALTLITGTTGYIFLKNYILLPEYMTCLEKSSWTILIIAIVWTGLASWRRLTK